MTLLEKVKSKFPDIVYENHYSDLYLYLHSLKNLEDFLKLEKISYSKFTDAIDHVTWIEIPFGYNEYFN